GLRTTTWEPDSPAVWNQKSRGEASLSERTSLSSAVRPTSTVSPSGETNRRAIERPCHIPFSGSGGGGGPFLAMAPIYQDEGLVILCVPRAASRRILER